MTPRVEVDFKGNVPDGLIALNLKSIGGEIVTSFGIGDGIEMQIPTTKLCPATLTRGLQYHRHGTLDTGDLIDPFDYKPIFDALRKNKISVQVDALWTFFDLHVKDFPGKTHDFACLLTELNNLTVLNPDKDLDVAEVEKLAREYLGILGWNQPDIQINLISNPEDVSSKSKEIYWLNQNIRPSTSKILEHLKKQNDEFRNTVIWSNIKPDKNEALGCLQKIAQGAMRANLDQQNFRRNPVIYRDLLELIRAEMIENAGQLAVIKANEKSSDLTTSRDFYFKLLKMGCLPLGFDRSHYNIFIPQPIQSV